MVESSNIVDEDVWVSTKHSKENYKWFEEGRKQGAINSMKDELNFLNVLRISLDLEKKGFPNALTDRIFEIEKRLKELE